MFYYLSKFLAFSCLIIFSLCMVGLPYFPLLSLCSVILNIALVIATRKFKPLAFLFLFALTYIYVSIFYFVDGISLSLGYEGFTDPTYYRNVLLIHSFFLVVITLLLPRFDQPILMRELLPNRKSNLAFYLIVAAMLFITFISKTGTSIIESSGYSNENYKTESIGGLSIFEYFLVLVPLGYIYTNNETLKRWVLIGCIALFCIKGLLFGGRIETLQCGLLVFIFFVDNRKTNFLKLIGLSIVPLYILTIFGAVRSNPLLFLEDTSRILLLPFENSMILFGNQRDIYYSSNRLVGMVGNETITYWDRFRTFGYNLVAPVVPYGRLPEIANLAGFKKDVYPAGGGALMSVYFWVFLGYPGVMLLATYLGVIIRKIKSAVSTYFVLYMIMVLSTYPRWIGYNPITLFKLSIYVIPAYFLLRYVVERLETLSTHTSKYNA